MTTSAGLEMTYAVDFSPSQIERDAIALNREGEEGFRYAVSLLGQVDARWRRSFLFAQLNETGFFRYRLEADMRIKFNARSDSPEELRRLLERLRRLLTLANEAANRVEARSTI